MGWAKPVPVDLRNFRRPRQDMALTALAGPGSNFLLALAALGTGSLVLRFWSGSRAGAYLLLFLCQLAVLSVGLGLFNLIPCRRWTAPRCWTSCCRSGGITWSSGMSAI